VSQKNKKEKEKKKKGRKKNERKRGEGTELIRKGREARVSLGWPGHLQGPGN
jgi:hypothetical protein